MATFDQISNAETIFTPVSWTHTPVGTPTAVAVVIFTNDATISSVTYGGSSLTHAVTGDNGTYRTLVYGLASPPAGAQQVLIHHTSGYVVEGVAVTVTGSDLATCFRGSAAYGEPSTNNPSVNVVSAIGDLVLEGAEMEVAQAPGSLGSGQTSRATGDYDSSTRGWGISTKDGAAGSTTVSRTYLASVSNSMIGASFKSDVEVASAFFRMM